MRLHNAWFEKSKAFVVELCSCMSKSLAIKESRYMPSAYFQAMCLISVTRVSSDYSFRADAVLIKSSDDVDIRVNKTAEQNTRISQ